MEDLDRSLKLISLIAALALVSLFIFILTRNQMIDTDYSYHLHEIWTISKGHIFSDPFMAGGGHFPLKYGGPIDLVGALIYPVAGRYTVGILLVLSVPAFWYFSEKVFNFFTDWKTARLAALVAVGNPLFLFYLTTAKLPLLWGFVFFLASLYFYLEEKPLFAIPLGVLGVVTHPISIFLPLSLLLLRPEFKRWIKNYSISIGIFLIQTSVFFGLFHRILSSSSLQLWGLAVNAGVLALALGVAFKLRKESRMLSGLALVLLGVWIFAGLNGVWIPFRYLNRLGFQVFLVLTPFLMIKLRGFGSRKIFVSSTVFIVLALSATTVGCARFMEDNPQAYHNNHEDIGSIVGECYVHYATDGSALFELPRLENIRFSNTGREPFTQAPENKFVYENMLLEENATFVLIYGSSPRENLIRSLEYPKVYSKDNIALYRISPKSSE